jgi:hypothetical protein
MKSLVFFTLLTICNSDYFNKNENAPTDEISWCVKMKCPDDGFGECTMVEVKAVKDFTKGNEQAKKKAKEKYPNCSALGAWEKNSQGCNCN